VYRYRERGNIEAQLFSIQAKLKANGQRLYTPPEGKTVRDIESAWIQLEKAEHERELALREELMRQEKLKRLAAKFDKRANIRETWCSEMIAVLQDQSFGNSMAQVEAALKKHEAISADVEATKVRYDALLDLAKTLYQENYNGRDRIKKKEKDVVDKWNKMMELLDKKKRVLDGFNELLDMFREIDSIQAELKDIEVRFMCVYTLILRFLTVGLKLDVNSMLLWLLACAACG
jgi:spectrin beta